MTWNGWQLNWWPVDSESDTLTTTTNWYMTVKTVVVVVVVACAVRVSTSSCLLFFSHLVPIHTLNTVSRLITSHSTHETFKCCSFVWIIGHLCTLHSISVQFTISRTGASVLCLPSSHWCHQATVFEVSFQHTKCKLLTLRVPHAQSSIACHLFTVCPT